MFRFKVRYDQMIEQENMRSPLGISESTVEEKERKLAKLIFEVRA